MGNDDPITGLLDELLEAHDRQRANERTSPPRSSFALRKRQVVLAALATLVITTSAAAVVVVTRRSAGLSGRLPTQLLGSRYALRVTPDLTAGDAGWCVSLLDRRASSSVLPVPENCVSSASKPVVFSGGVETLSPSTGAVAATLLYAVVDKRVTMLRTPDGARIRPVSSPLLPTDWRAAVTLSATSRHFRSGVLRLTPLSSRGQQLTARSPRLGALDTRSVDPARPPTSGCRIQAKPLAGLRLLGARALVSSPVQWHGTGYLSCYSVSFTYRGHLDTAAVLVSSAEPKSRSSRLPGFFPVRGRPLVEEATISNGDGGRLGDYRGERLLARRIDGAWLALETEAGNHTGLRALDALDAFG